MNNSRCIDLETPKDMVIAFSQREDGNMARTNETREEVMNRRHRFLEAVGLGARTIALIHPTHSPNIELAAFQKQRITREVILLEPKIQADFDNYGDGSDGLLTFDQKIAVALISADCIPLVIWSTESNLHGILHVGLLGVLNNMVSGLSVLLNEVGLHVSALRCHLGPSIAAKDYFISTSGLWKAIEQQAFEKVPHIHDYLGRSGDETTLDIQRMLVDELADIGIPRDGITIHPGSTASSDSAYFSHHSDRNQHEKRRFMSVIGFTDEYFSGKSFRVKT